MSISVNNLTKLYGTQKALDTISFNIGKGEIVGFLGPNGAGKSTTMKIITGYLQPDGGHAQICGLDVGDDGIRVKNKIGYLPEGNPLYYDMYIREYLGFVAAVHKVEGLKKKVNDIITTVGLTSEANKKIGQLSKGYKQRVGLAAALIHDPEVLILDEPTTGLDPNQIVEIRDVIKRFGQDKTVLFSTHILQEVQAICDRVIIINKGRIVADDSLANLQNMNDAEQVVIVEIVENISIDSLLKMQHITSGEQLPGGVYRLYTSDSLSVRKQLMELSLQNNWNIVSLQTEQNSLEEIFRSLTGTIN